MFFIVITDNQVTQGRSWGIKMLQSAEVFIQSYNLLIAQFTYIYLLHSFELFYASLLSCQLFIFSLSYECVHNLLILITL